MFNDIIRFSVTLALLLLAGGQSRGEELLAKKTELKDKETHTYKVTFGKGATGYVTIYVWDQRDPITPPMYITVTDPGKRELSSPSYRGGAPLIYYQQRVYAIENAVDGEYVITLKGSGRYTLWARRD